MSDWIRESLRKVAAGSRQIRESSAPGSNAFAKGLRKVRDGYAKVPRRVRTHSRAFTKQGFTTDLRRVRTTRRSRGWDGI
eukprot:3243142-Prymnesium_polylepis.1